MPSTDRTVLVRTLGSDVTHIVTVPASAIRVIVDLTETEFDAVPTPVVTACGALLRGHAGQPVAIVMTRAKVRCSRCRRLTGITAVDEHRAHQRTKEPR